jgi:class 3 adenylate cyclase
MAITKYFKTLIVLVALCYQSEASGQLTSADSIEIESLENQVFLSRKEVLTKTQESPKKIKSFFEQIERINSLEQQKSRSYILVESGQTAVLSIILIITCIIVFMLLIKQKDTKRLSALRNQERRLSQTLSRLLPDSAISNFLENENLDPVKWKDCTVLFIEVQERVSYRSPKKRFAVMNELVQNAEAILKEFGLVKIKFSVNQLVSICKRGKHTPLQQVNATVSCAIKLRKVLLNFQGNDLGFKAGISYGDVLSGFIGSKRLRFDIWGQSVSESAVNMQSAKNQKIKVSRYIMRSLDKDQFEIETNLSESSPFFEL